jgi:hypothetical protein
MNSPAELGRASLEFLVGAIILFLPLLALQTTLYTVAQAQLAVETAARHGARVFVQQVSIDAAKDALRRSVEDAVRGYGIDAAPSIAVQCRPSGACLAPGSFVDVSVSASVPIGQLVPVPVRSPLTIPIWAHGSAQVSVYRGEP